MIFPVKVPYTVSADISKYVGPAFNPSPTPAYLEQKMNELTQWSDSLCVQYPAAQSYVNLLAKYCGFLETDSLRAIALQLEEDLAIMVNGKLSAICFCFPSGFVPKTKLGESFFDLHLPVSDGERLRASSEKVMQVICKPDAMYRRYVWTITSLGSLSQLSHYERPLPVSLDDLYFRTETQTTVGVDGSACFFFVKVDNQPLSLIWEDKEKRSVLMDSLNSMSDAVVQYKHLTYIRELLKKW